MHEYQNFKTYFAKFYTPNWWEEFFVIKGVKFNILSAYVIEDLNVEEIVRMFYKKIFWGQIKQNLGLTLMKWVSTQKQIVMIETK